MPLRTTLECLSPSVTPLSLIAGKAKSLPKWSATLTVFHSTGRIKVSLPTNIRLGWHWLTATNTVGYYGINYDRKELYSTGPWTSKRDTDRQKSGAIFGLNV
jgi:hypothetical protein